MVCCCDLPTIPFDIRGRVPMGAGNLRHEGYRCNGGRGTSGHIHHSRERPDYKFKIFTVKSALNNNNPQVTPAPAPGLLANSALALESVIRRKEKRHTHPGKLARVVRAAGMKRRRRISSFSFCICLSKESTTNKCCLDSRRRGSRGLRHADGLSRVCLVSLQTLL